MFCQEEMFFYTIAQGISVDYHQLHQDLELASTFFALRLHLNEKPYVIHLPLIYTVDAFLTVFL